jgi:hypothetical protein
MNLTKARNTRPMTAAELKQVRARLLPTWQTGAAIAQHAGLPAKTTIAALTKKANEWGLERRVIRIDGHNEVSLWRKRQLTMVLGVSFPMAGDEDDEYGEHA